MYCVGDSLSGMESKVCTLRGGECANMLYVVGIGPGGPAYMTKEAEDALWESDIIFGDTTCVKLIKAYYPHKEYDITITQDEKVYCERALAESEKGRCVSYICSGDSAVYGAAALIYRMAEEHQIAEKQMDVIAGVTAALSGGAVLGAPLSGDFMVVSLDDRQTSWEKIERRISCAAMSDTILCLYNTTSEKQYHTLRRVCDLVLEYQSEKTVCGYVENIGREGESYKIVSLKELKEIEPDDIATIFIGNSETVEVMGKMVTYHI